MSDNSTPSDSAVEMPAYMMDSCVPCNAVKSRTLPSTAACVTALTFDDACTCAPTPSVVAGLRRAVTCWVWGTANGLTRECPHARRS